MSAVGQSGRDRTLARMSADDPKETLTVEPIELPNADGLPKRQ